MSLPTLADLDLNVSQLAILTNPEFGRRCCDYLPPSDPDVEELVAMGLLRPFAMRWSPSRNKFNSRSRWVRARAWHNGRFLMGPSAECRAILKTAYDLPAPNRQSSIVNRKSEGSPKP